MCMLSFIPAGIEPEEQDLLNGGIINADGSGWAIAAKDEILMGKSMKVEEALDEFMQAKKKHLDCPALFHSRWATHGTTNIANVHPFLVGGSHKTVVAHNGILPCKPAKSDWRSDTRILADEYLQSRYRRFDKPRAMEALEGYIGKNNKLVILTVDDKYKENAYIVNEKMGNWDEVTGVWHSNYDYIGRAAKYPTWYERGGYGTTYVKNDKGVWVADMDSNHCLFCGYGLVGKSGYCLDCGTCVDCGEYRKECRCHPYTNFDWDQTVIGRKALESPKADEAQTDNYARGGMSVSDIMDQIDKEVSA